MLILLLGLLITIQCSFTYPASIAWITQECGFTAGVMFAIELRPSQRVWQKQCSGPRCFGTLLSVRRARQLNCMAPFHYGVLDTAHLLIYAGAVCSRIRSLCKNSHGCNIYAATMRVVMVCPLFSCWVCLILLRVTCLHLRSEYAQAGRLNHDSSCMF